jgi:hypothetical protein
MLVFRSPVNLARPTEPIPRVQRALPGTKALLRTQVFSNAVYIADMQNKESETMKITVTAVAIAGALLLTACGGSSSDDAATTESEDSAVVTVEPECQSEGRTQGTGEDRERCEDGAWVGYPEVVTTINELERNQAVNEYIDAAAFHAECLSDLCFDSQATYDRYEALMLKAYEIPGDDVAPYQADIDVAWRAWKNCLGGAGSRDECATEEGALAVAVDALYNALR